jgi:Secretion system C-terminal sorting domain
VGSTAAANQPGLHNYAFTDNDMSALGVPFVYYRLKLIDIDGRFVYSNIITLIVDSKHNIMFYPNPVMDNATLTITFTEPEYLQARIIDNVGRVVRQQQWNVVPGNTSLHVNVSQLAGGMYFLELKGKTLNRRIQFLKM